MECANTLEMAVGIATNVVLLPVVYISDPTIRGFRLAAIVTARHHNLPDVISINCPIDHYIGMLQYGSNCKC